MRRNIYNVFAGISVWGIIIAVTSILFYPFIVLAEATNDIFSEIAAPEVRPFLSALSDKHWPLAVAFGVMFLVWVFRYIIKDKLPKNLIPYFIIGATILSGASARIIQFTNDGLPWWHGLIQGIIEGATAGWASMGMYSSGGKKLPLPKQE